VNPVAITYSQKDIGNIDIVGFYPSTKIRIRLSNNVESCLTVEYILPLTAGDQIELYMFGDSTNAQIIYISGNPATVPAIPDTPSIILTIVRIA
jgi:hypothetical protein